MIIELVENIALLVTLAVGLQMLARRWEGRPILYGVAAGLLFGAVGVAGMMIPLRFAPGVIYDGRSIVLGLAGLFGGPVPASISAVMCAAYRIHLGGGGAAPGVGVIIEAAAIGVALRYLWQRDARWVSPLSLWAVGLLIHVVMLLLQVLLLPGGAGWEVLRRIGPTVLAMYPLAFLLVAQVFLEGERRRKAEAELLDAQERMRLAILVANLGTWDWDIQTGEVVFNELWAKMLGYDLNEIKPHLHFWEQRVHPDDMPRVRQGEQVHLEGKTDFYETEHRLRHKNGSWIWVLDKGQVIERDGDGKPLRAFGVHLDITDRKQATEAIRESEERFRSLVEGAPDAIFVQTDGRFAYLNQAALGLFGVSSPADLLGQPVIERVHPASREMIQQRIEGLNRQKQQVPPVEATYLKTDGTEVPVEFSAVPTIYDGRDGAIVFVRDISRRKGLEAQLLQSQKLEAIGRLAGGVAHDFNNMLQTILGYSDILLYEFEPSHPVHGQIQEIHDAAQRSADLTRHLLAFARKQTIVPKTLDLNEAVAGTLKMLRRLIGEEIELDWRPGGDAWPVRMDPAQVNQILVNLVVNSRDAISGPGRIVIETAAVTLNEKGRGNPKEFIPGQYTQLCVSDDGEGMDDKTLSQVFEPFFTTKSRDKGTGLGLATVYGIVQQNKGVIDIQSKPGQGTTVRVCLPRDEKGENIMAMGTEPAVRASGTETVLLVEDEPSILKLTRQLLQQLGYTVLTATDPAEALQVAQGYDGEIHLLMTDVIMPQMNGCDLWAKLLESRPSLPCIFMSGYTANAVADRGVIERGACFLQKPFAMGDLAAKLREALDKTGPKSAPPSQAGGR